MKLNIKLRDGFSDDKVSIKVNGKEVYDKSGVTSDLSVSFADSVELDTERDNVKVEVAVEGGESEEKSINVKETPFVDVWRSPGKLELRASEKEVPML